MPVLVGTPSDDVPSILATGRSGVTMFSVNMSARHPEGRDAEFLRWHTFDHRVEHARVAGLRASLRLVSTPACRAARVVSEGHYDAVDHVVTYFFSSADALEAGLALSEALGRAGRMPYSLPPIERGDFNLDGMIAAPRVKVGADVLPWWPCRGVYMLVQELVDQGEAAAGELADVPGVAGAWWGSTVRAGPQSLPGDGRLQVTYCFLDDDPVSTAERLRGVLERPWRDAGVEPLLAAPFYPVAGYECDLHLP